VAHYRIVDHLGEGGMGVVLLAHDETLGRNVALKLLSAQFANDLQFRGRFMRESRLAAAIDHPNIIPIYEAGEADGQLFIAMRYVAGVDLRELLAAEGSFSTERAIALADQMARALDAAHIAGLVHRDVKPGNVLVDRSEGREHCYLTDFGLTKNIASSSGFTETGQFVGTLSYMAPEQIEGRGIDGRADIYALGCVLFECLAGVPPFRRESDVAMMYAHLREPPPSLSAARADLPPAVDTVMERALAKAPGDRHATCLDLVAELQATLAGVPVRPFAPSSVGTGRRFARPPAAPPPPSDVSTRGEPLAAPRPAPPPPPVPLYRPPRAVAPPPRGRGYMKAAVIVALAILLTAGGVVAALLLTKTSGPSAADQQALLDRTNKLARDLEALKRQVQDGQIDDARAQARIRKEQAEARRLIADSNRQQAAVNRSLIAANNHFIRALDALSKYVTTGKEHWVIICGTQIAKGTGATKRAEKGMGGDSPRPTNPKREGAVSARRVELPGDEIATITAPPDQQITSVLDVGNVGGDEAHDFGVLTDFGPYVVFGGNTTEDLKLSSLDGSDRGFVPLGAAEIAPAGDFYPGGPDDLVTSTGDHTFSVATDPASGPGGDVNLGIEGKLPTKAGDLDNDGQADLAAWDGGDSVTVTLEAGSSSFTITGDGKGFGASLTSVGDMNRDDAPELVIGSPEQNAAYVIYSSESPADIRISDLQSTQGFKISGSPAGSALGTGVVGLENGDVLVTAPDASPHGRAGAGAAYIVRRHDDGSPVDLARLGEGGYKIEGAATNGHFGSSAAFAGGGSDVVIGTAGNDDALAYVISAQSSNDAIDLASSDSPAFHIHGTSAGGKANLVAGNVDFDGNGAPDMLIPAEDGRTAYVVPVPR
jgi:serine/threonine-protein kinase